eukprot:1718889-Amphidinium_carterae.1
MSRMTQLQKVVMSLMIQILNYALIDYSSFKYKNNKLKRSENGRRRERSACARARVRVRVRSSLNRAFWLAWTVVVGVLLYEGEVPADLA